MKKIIVPLFLILPLINYGQCIVNAGVDQSICEGDVVILSGSGALTYSWDNGVSDGVPFSPTSTTTYTVIGNIGTCSDTSQVTVFVEPSTIPFNYCGITKFCVGNSDPIPNITGVPDGSFFSSSGLVLDSLTGTIDLSSSSPGNYQVSYISNFFQMGADLDGETAGDKSGFSVSMNSIGDIVAIGSCLNNSITGHVRVYIKNNSGWVQMGQDIDGEFSNDWSGYSVSINSVGNRLAIGAPYNDGNGSNSGHVRVYEYNGLSWIQMGADIDGEAANDKSGYSVSINADGDKVAIGAPFNEGYGPNSGHVRIFSWNGMNWIQQGQDIDAEAADNESGCSISMNSVGDIVAIGARKNYGNGISAGHVRVYTFNGTSWVKIGQDIDGESADDHFGSSVSMNSTGNIFSAGAFRNDGNGSNSGHVRVFEYNGTSWIQLGQDIDGEAPFDQLGTSLSMNDSGDKLAIGAPFNDVNANNVGHVKVYEYDGFDWIQMVADIDGEANGDLSGKSVSMNSLGNRLAIGAEWNDGNGSNSGHVRVYNQSNSCALPLNITISTDSIPLIIAPSDQTICVGDSVILNAYANSNYSWSNGVIDGVPFPVSTTTTYTVTATGANGCKNSDSSKIIVNQYPVLDAGPDLNICEGDYVILSGSGADTYFWDNGVLYGTPFIPTVSGIYTLIGYNGSCADTSQLAINFSPCLYAGQDQIICLGDSVVLTGSGGSNYTWDNNIVDGVSFAPLTTKTYTLTGLVNSLIDSSKVTITVLPNLSNFDYAGDTSFCLGEVNPIPNVFGTSSGVFSSSNDS